jgi:hypothetical protein
MIRPRLALVLDPNNRCYKFPHPASLPGRTSRSDTTTRWKTLRRITLCPQRIGAITKAALVLTQFEHQGRC